MTFFKLDPEVAGGWGHNTECVRTPGKPLVVKKLHYAFDGWLGDELLESSPCFIVTDRLAEAIRGHDVTGYELRDVEVSTSEQFRELYPNRQLPRFKWLHIMGLVGVDDFGVACDGRLVVSDKALAVLRTQQLRNCAIEPLT